MTYKIGTRVKKVRGIANIGLTGVVVDLPISPYNEILGCDMVISPDFPCTNVLTGEQDMRPGAARSCEWEPIIPDGSDTPSTMSIHELLDARNYEQVYHN